MYAARNTNRHDLLNCDDDDDGNGAIRQFYRDNLPSLMMYPVPSVPCHILQNIAVLLHHTLLFKSEWQEYATMLGVTNYLLLAKIQASAKVSQNLELFITLKMALQHKMFGHVILVLLKKPRYDILKAIQSDVKELLESNSTTEVKEIASIHRQSIECKTTGMIANVKESNNEKSSVRNLNHKNLCKVDTFAQNPSLLNKNKKETIVLHQSSDKDFTDAPQSHISLSIESPPKESSVFPHEGSSVSPREEKSLASPDKESSVEEINLFPSAPAQERLTVFIQHSEMDADIANDLSRLLKEEGFIVTTLSDMKTLVAMDNTRGALTTIFQQVDFIIPVVSEKFLKQIHPNVYDRYIESADAQDNIWLYKLIMNEYMNNRCVNFRVRPVIVPKMNRQLLITDVILSYSFRLWGEVPKLINILKQTKVLIPEYSRGNE